ncbi:MAG TPA: FAD-dependent oxidoreductase [Burkholderiaceae bacterium]|nr:FAD-dependent oxidoreductase [Burkholderiaceae bacterium]
MILHDDMMKRLASEMSERLNAPAADLPRLSIWDVARETNAFPMLSSDLSVDVAVIGGGITGITAAAELMRAGRTVAVLEAARIGAGTTGRATGNLYAMLDESLFKLGKKWGDDIVEMVVRSRSSAIDLIERNITDFHIECDFARQPWVLYTIHGSPADQDRIENEYNAARGAGLDTRLVKDLPLPYMITKALVVHNQAQFNPLAYVRQLATAIRSQQCQIFEDTPVFDLDTDEGFVNTAAHTVRADHIVMATHTPKGFNMVQTELGAYREYAVAALMKDRQLPGGIFWSIGENPTSTRMLQIGGKPYVLMIGEKHKTGQRHDPDGAYRLLQELLHTRFNADAPVLQWSAQQYRSADGLPYIGSSAGPSRLYLASGFGADGLTYGTLAGMIITDEICGRENRFAELYSPRRFTPMKSAKNFFRENLNVAGHYIKDYTQSPALKSIANVAPGEGALVDIDGDKLAVYRDRTDQLHVLSPVCTHLKCIVHWNRAENSWDCPCHGSRFNFDGTVIEGPALMPLQRHDAISKIDTSLNPPA